jgi:uncharacterized protein
MNDWVLRQLKERQIPATSPVMFQGWKHLLFLHWRWDPDEIQKRLPVGLAVDCFDRSGWIGIVPFFMEDVRLIGCPPLPMVSNFLELNLRTYVTDAENRPGIWFFSLDANQPFAVWSARAFFALPYWHARMQAMRTDGWIEYRSARDNRESPLIFRYHGTGPTSEAALESLEFFLIERYRLFASRRGQLFSGKVYHTPYQLGPVDLGQHDGRLFELDGFPAPIRPPDHIAYAPRVDASIYPLEPVQRFTLQ